MIISDEDYLVIMSAMKNIWWFAIYVSDEDYLVILVITSGIKSVWIFGDYFRDEDYLAIWSLCQRWRLFGDLERLQVGISITRPITSRAFYVNLDVVMKIPAITLGVQGSNLECLSCLLRKNWVLCNSAVGC